MPLLTAQALVGALLTQHLVPAPALVSALGVRRHDADVRHLGTTLVVANLISIPALSAVAAEVAGLEPLTDLNHAPCGAVPETIARRADIVALPLGDPSAHEVVLVCLDANPDTLAEATEALAAAVPAQHVAQVLVTVAPHLDGLLAAAYTRLVPPRTPDGIAEVLDAAIATGASDVHLNTGRLPAVRVHGGLRTLDAFTELSGEWLEAEISELAGPDKMVEYHENWAVDFAYGFGDRRFRVNAARDRVGPTFTARLLPADIPDMGKIGLSETVQGLTGLTRGLVLITGPTGSGKSTTLASMLAHLARTQDRHILTLEDPIEFVLPSDGAGLVTQRELTRSFRSFPLALRALLRQDPDVILLGEMRDRETIAAALEAAETGHLVFGTLHTFSAKTTVDRIVSQFPADEQDHVRAVLANILCGVVAQTLLPTADGKGRVAAHETMIVTSAVAAAIRSNGDLELPILTGAQHGMKLMDTALAELVVAGKVTHDIALSKTRDPKSFGDKLATAKRTR